MNLKDLKPAGQLMQRFGVKSILYGKPGTGKTPMINTAPRPLLLACEAGLKSMSQSTVPTFEGFTPEAVDEFFKWFFGSNEAAQFDTLAIDSGSQLAENILTRELKKQKDGRKAYGELSINVMEHFNKLYFLPQKHIVVICKQMQQEVGKTVVQQGGAFVVEMTYQAQPYFPGQDLNIKVPHLFDEILHASYVQMPGMTKPVCAIRTSPTSEILARDRSGMLAELEPPDLTALFNKAMQ